MPQGEIQPPRTASKSPQRSRDKKVHRNNNKPASAAPPAIYRRRRDRLIEAMGDAVAVIPAAPKLRKSRDTAVRYRQASNLFYLTGYSEPGAVAVLTPHDPEHRFTLFVRPRDAEREVWDGSRAGVQGALEDFGADAAYPFDELGDHLEELLEPAPRVLYALGTSVELDRRIAELVAQFRHSRQRTGPGPLSVEDTERLLGEMRLVKDEWELQRIREAAELAVAGHRAAIAAAAPGVGEWEIEAALEREFRRAGASGPAFPSIVAAGSNATVLHYTANDQLVREGDLVLVDAGAELAMYASDITRTFPASGRFSAAQRQIYDLVLAAEDAAILAITPGVPASAPHDAALEILIPGMVSLGLLEGSLEEQLESEEYKQFFMHKTSHWLGLDVHDAGLYSQQGEPVTLREGMVLTVEPGIYIPADAKDLPAELLGIGIRIEDDVLVTATGHEVLTRGVPVDPQELSALVGTAASQPAGAGAGQDLAFR